MATKSIDIKCPECGAVGSFEIWNSIDLEENPPLEEKARSGSLFRYACPECGIITKVAYPTLIHDSAHKRMLYLATDREMFESIVRQYAYGGSSAAGGLLEGDYMVRAVRTVPELSELMRIIHAQLDDRVIALMKLFVFQEVTDNNPGYEFDNLFFMDRMSRKTNTSLNCSIMVRPSDRSDLTARLMTICRRCSRKLSKSTEREP